MGIAIIDESRNQGGMTDDDIELSLLLQDADDYWNRTHRTRWLLRHAAFGALLIAAALAIYIPA